MIWFTQGLILEEIWFEIPGMELECILGRNTVFLQRESGLKDLGFGHIFLP